MNPLSKPTLQLRVFILAAATFSVCCAGTAKPLASPLTVEAASIGSNTIMPARSAATDPAPLDPWHSPTSEPVTAWLDGDRVCAGEDDYEVLGITGDWKLEHLDCLRGIEAIFLGRIDEPMRLHILERGDSIESLRTIPESAEEIRAIGQLTNLRTLHLEKRDIGRFHSGRSYRVYELGDDDFVELAKLTQLRHLDLHQFRVTEPRLERLQALTRLRSLSFTAADLSSESLSSLAGLTELRKLHVSLFSFDDDALAQVAGLTHLQSLHWLGDRITDRGLAIVGSFRDLRVLHFEAGSRITDAGLAHIGGLRRLEELTLTDTSGFSQRGLRHIAGLTELRALSLRGTTFGDGPARHLAGLVQLQRLDLASTAITDVGVAHLAGLTELRRLELPSTRVGDDGVARLSAMHQLEWLDLRATQISDQALVALPNMRAGVLLLSRLNVSRTAEAAMQRNAPDLRINVESGFLETMLGL